MNAEKVLQVVKELQLAKAALEYITISVVHSYHTEEELARVLTVAQDVQGLESRLELGRMERGEDV